VPPPPPPPIEIVAEPSLWTGGGSGDRRGSADVALKVADAPALCCVADIH
jgi:hypothetical protein